MNKHYPYPAVQIDTITAEKYRKTGAGMILQYDFLNTPFGECLVGTIGNRICAMDFCDNNPEELLLILQQKWPRSEMFREQNIVQNLLKGLFQKPSPISSPIPLLLQGTPFQLDVWRALTEVPFGATTSYSQLAAAVGRPAAVRAVGTAVGKNPVSFIVPCHRIVRNTGEIGQYHWGPERKAAIIEWEKKQRSSRPSLSKLCSQG